MNLKIALGLILIAATASVSWLVLGKSTKSTKLYQDPNTIYVRHYESSAELSMGPNGIQTGECHYVDVTFLVTKDSAFLGSADKEFPLRYVVLGVDKEMGLHVLTEASTETVFYKYKDNRDTTKHILLMKNPKSAILFFQLPTCPETVK